MEAETGVWELLQVAQVLADGDIRPQEHRVYRPRAGGGAVDVQGIDTDEGGLLFLEPERRSFREEGVTFEVLVRTPVPCPTGMHQHCLATHVRACEQLRTVGLFLGMEHQAL